MDISREQVEAAAQWWTDRLTDCRHSGLSAQERHDPRNQSYQFAEMLMTVNRPRVTEEQIAMFRTALVDAISAASVHEQHWLSVDYHPDRVLCSALEAAGIDPSMGTMPIKTSMSLRDGTVVVRYGYGAEPKQIYPSEEGQ